MNERIASFLLIFCHIVCLRCLGDTLSRYLAFRKLEVGVEDALDGIGLEGLGVFADWRRDRDVLCRGGAATLREEIMGVAQRCRDASSDVDALSILELYTEERR